MKKNIFMLLLVLSCLLSSCSSTSSVNSIEEVTKSEITSSSEIFLNSRTTPSGFPIEEGVICTINNFLTYEVVHCDNDFSSVIEEAEKYVRKWWNDDSTFCHPKIIWCKCIDGNFRGFQDSGYIFLNVETSREDLLATIVHEWLHDLVSPQTLKNEYGIGHHILEMIVETITIDILQGEISITPTDEFWYFISCDELYIHKDELIEAFRNSEDFSVYEKIFGPNYMDIINKVNEDFS